MEGAKGREGEVGDVFGIAAGFAAVAGVGEEAADGVALKYSLRGREDALHLAIHDAVVAEVAGGRSGVCGGEVVCLAGKGLVGKERVEYGVEIDIGQVEEVGLDGGADGVISDVVASQGVDERGDRALDHLEEWLLAGEFLGACEGHVLEDMGHPGVIRRRCGNGDAEAILGFRAADVENARAGGGVAELDGLAPHGRERSGGYGLKALCDFRHKL